MLKGPNGIGKSTLLESIAKGTAKGAKVSEGVKVGYYRQDFSTLNFEETVHESLLASMEEKNEERMRSVASGFFLNNEVISTKIGNLSEGQKGLVAFAKLIFERPGLLLLDEPTNHMDKQLQGKVTAAIRNFPGAVVLSTHDKNVLLALAEDGGLFRGAVRTPTHVTLEKKDGKKFTYTIVGSQEANPDEGKISNESIVGKALLGKKEGDEIAVETLNGKTSYKILNLE